MTWSISFNVDDGKIDPETLRGDGELPNGFVSMCGHSGDRSKSVSVQIDDMTTTATWNE